MLKTTPSDINSAAQREGPFRQECPRSGWPELTGQSIFLAREAQRDQGDVTIA